MSSVRRSRGILWSNNELHAHKKNVGEEARLLGDLDLIRRRMALSTSGIQVALTKVHSDLKEVRTSTGHSVDGLPPTPFRLRRLRRGQKRVSIQSSKEFQSPRSPLPNYGILKRLFPATTPQQAQPYRRHLNTFQNVKDDTVKNAEHPSATENLFPVKEEQHLFNIEGGMNVKDHDGTLTNGEVHLPASVKLHRNASDISNPGKSERVLATSKSLLSSSLSPTTKRSVSDLTFNPPDYHPEELMELLPRISRMEVPNVGRSGRRVSAEFTLPDVSDLRRYPDLTEEEEVHPLKFKKTVDEKNRREGRNLEREDSCVSSTSLRKEGLQQEKLKPALKQQTNEDDNRRGSTTSVTPLGRELTEMIQTVREKNAELLAGKAAAVAINSKSTQGEAQDQHQRDQDQVKLVKARNKAVPSKLPSNRYRCRTCEERLRDNTRYRQSLKKHLEHKAATTHGEQDHVNTVPSLTRYPNSPPKIWMVTLSTHRECLHEMTRQSQQIPTKEDSENTACMVLEIRPFPRHKQTEKDPATLI
ncbi:hypothetical protein V1264_015537 [Littorina saxatilis]|uniref:Uncharacterized protein n=1 Tax=Littorina saxatilis TaxID=31220 RepID=A0AAN9BK67_9CAEN